MSELGDWINQLHMQGAFTIPEQGGGVMPIPAPPPTEDMTRTPPTQPAPTVPDQTPTPTTTPPVGVGTSPLELFLRAYHSGHFAGGLTPEMYAHFGGDEIMRQLQQYDPGAHWEDTLVGGGGEGAGAGVMGKKFVGGTPGQIITPASKSGIDLLNLRPANFGSGGLYRPDMVFNDDIYGQVTHSGNIKDKVEGLERYAPYIAAAIAMGGPALGGALLAGGLGGVGLTSAVTGGAAGLGAGSIPGALGAGSFASGANAPWWAKTGVKAIPTLGRAASGMAAAAPVARAPVHTSTGDYNPQAYNRMGNSPAPSSSDSSLVATNFAEDPYGMSRGRG
jgi:hypothetical protein